MLTARSMPFDTPGEAITPVIVTYNSAKILPWSLPALSACREVIIVDNCSADDTVAVAATLLPQARIIRAPANLGFGRANNLGLDAVTTPYALILNPDSQLLPGSLDALDAAARRYPDAALLAPVLYDAPGVIGDSHRGPVSLPRGSKPIAPDGDLCVEFITGAAMLVNLDATRDIGHFDPWFFLYFEDDDLCLRVRRAGRQIVVAHDAAVEHHTRQSSAPSVRSTLRRFYCMALSKLYLTRKYGGTRRCAALALRMGLGSLLALPLQLLAPRRERILRHLARVAATVMAWRHLDRAHCFVPRD